MSVDHIGLLRWMATRERRQSDYIDGMALLADAGHLAGADLLPREAMARALELLRRENCVIWQADPEPGLALSDPLDADSVLRLAAIRVTVTGHTICAASESQTPAQINIFNYSSVGQVGMGDNRIGDIHLLLSRAQEELDRMDLPDDVREEARGTLERLQGAAAHVATPAAASVLALALEKASHLA